MECNGSEFLRQATRIAGRANRHPARSIRDLLRLLVDTFDLPEATLLLTDSRHVVRAVLTASGPDEFRTCADAIGPGPEREALTGRIPVLKSDLLCFPLPSQSPHRGLLRLQAESAAAATEVVPETIEELFSPLVALLERRQRLIRQQLRRSRQDHLRTTTENLGRVRDLRQMRARATAVMLEVEGVVGAVLRLSPSGSPPRRHARVQPGCGKWRRRFLDLEARYVDRTCGGRPVHYRSIPPEDAGDTGFELFVVPLLFQERPFGSLCLFFAEASICADEEFREYLASLGWHVAQAVDRIADRERLAALSAENDRKLRETTLLYNISRAMHSTLRLNELVHLILSAAVAPEWGGFERAMLFTINERSDTLQGMLGVSRRNASLVLPGASGVDGWERFLVSEEAQAAQRRSHFCRRVMKQRLPFDAGDNALARAASRCRVVYVPRPEDEPATGAALAGELELAPYACAPLAGRERTLGVIVVDNPASREPLPPDRLRFLELFANQAAAAMENSMLVHRLEGARADLQETQERLIHGEKMAVLGEMSASVAHELRNPLVSIGGFAQRLARIAEAGSREQEYGAIIAREVKRMEEMLTNILAFSKKQMLCFTGCRIAEMIEEALHLEGDALRRQEIAVEKDLAQNLPIVQGDEKKLQQVLINLVVNARQAMPDGGLLTIKTCRTTLRGEKAVAVMVEDTGGGIAADVMRNIFNPFFTTREEGTGLGLSISHRIVEHHRGEIEVQNLEQGALFTLRLPVDGEAHLSIDKKRRFG